MYGLKVPASLYRLPARDVIAAPERTASGNVVIRLGQEDGTGWHQTGHVVLEVNEARELATEILASVADLIAGGAPMPEPSAREPRIIGITCSSCHAPWVNGHLCEPVTAAVPERPSWDVDDIYFKRSPANELGERRSR